MSLLRQVGRIVVAATRALRRTWRRSLQFRVVTTTVILGLVVVSLLGSYLYNEIATGLENDKIQTSEYEARGLTATAQEQWENTTVTTAQELNQVAQDIMGSKLTPPGPEPSRYVVMLRGVKNTSPTQLNALESNKVGLSSVTQDIRQKVAADPTHQQKMVSDVIIDGKQVPAVFIGTGVDVPIAGRYDLYYIYPMTQELGTMSLISTAFGIAGLILTFLVGVVAWVVTKQVVSPVRRAAEVAERLASGKLNERMASRGEDDLALLGTSFNAMADSLQAQIRQLEGLSRVQQRFVSDVSHELRTPLTTIRMAGDLLYDSRTDFDPIVGRSAELLQGELDRFELLLSDLLEISRFDAGAAALDLAPVDLRGTVAGVVAATQPLADRRGSTIEIVASGPIQAEVDERRVERILRNLVVNAIEHGDGKPITVHLREGDGAVAVVVEDHGVGLRQGEASMVFTRFWRADPARARTTGGTGLGLAIALEDARLHSGWLQAWGEPGVGARFRLTLPQRSGESLTSSPLALSPGERT
ncbi:putative two-component system histidine kinase [Janibacter sp. HTCC2649]|uniref:MtrAB system histidine kinase MtrB n=1 Tax=Janibacter sp. HTCC2649 TaxID=313589 RepID=UPI0000670F0E|nr:MtrAB system histidine kinase MtrB [Janibacter sp. HTCC2649]EAP97572.1 putative two-component system histidine kinase [Janibacter sp. HTCC2649]